MTGMMRWCSLVVPLVFITAVSCGKAEDQNASGPTPSPPAHFDVIDGPLPSTAVHGQIVYVPIYSSIYSHSSKRMIELTATLSVHNTDAKRDIFVRGAKYFDTSGRLLEERAPKPIRLAPMQTISMVVELTDKRGGAGANFVVEWVGDEGARAPVIEAVMVNVSLSNAMAFTSVGRVVETIGP